MTCDPGRCAQRDAELMNVGAARAAPGPGHQWTPAGRALAAKMCARIRRRGGGGAARGRAGSG